MDQHSTGTDLRSAGGRTAARGRALDVARFCSLLFVALALGPSAAHLLELPNKIGLSRADYLTVQHIYNGWALLGIVVLGALASTLALAILSRRQRQFTPSLLAFLCVVAAQVVFWSFTYPANQATRNWTELPQAWQPLRTQWEYSHAAGALLNLAAMVLLIGAAVGAARAAGDGESAA
jgi:hypothetical protein